jgi:ABC-type multidrug transport system fused ATPase/permease subunit
MKKGEVVQYGPPMELLKQEDGLFAQLYKNEN